MAKLSQETYDKIVELYQQKFTQTIIAQECKCSVDTVRRTLQKVGLLETKLSPKLQAIYDSVVAGFNEGKYCKELANEYQVDEHSIYKILDKAGIKRQTGYRSKCNETYFSSINNPHKAYLLGFITADGTIVNEVLSIEVHKDDIAVLEFAKTQINPSATLTPTRDCFKVTFGAKALARDLSKYGIIQNKSKLIKQVPIDLIPRSLLPFYFRGLIDGDGCIHKDGRIAIYSGSRDFIEHVQNILIQEAQVKKLGIYEGTTFFIQWGSREDKEKLFHYLYNDLNATFYYKRKYDRLNEILNNANTEVTS